MKKIILYSVFAVLLLSCISGMAQVSRNQEYRGKPPAQTSTIVEDETIHDAKTMIMLSPQFLVIDQIRIEIDRKIRDNHWITLAPHYVQDFSIQSKYQNHWGFGLAASYKHFPNLESPFYVGGGLQFTHHVLDNYAFDDQPQADIWLYQTKITQYGANAVLGFYTRLLPYIYSDVYLGFGYRGSQTKSTDSRPHEFFNKFSNLGYKGWMIVAGVRIGIML